jgi:hypothetical protein
MRPLLLFVLLSASSLVSCSDWMGDGVSDEDSLQLAERITGVWIQDTVEWSIEPGSETLSWTSSLLSLNLHPDGRLSLQTKGVTLIGRDSIGFGTDPDRISYSGVWRAVDTTTAAIEYQLTYTDIPQVEVRTPGPLLRDTLRWVNSELIGLDHTIGTTPRSYRLERPSRLTRESMRVLTWRDSIG